MLFILMAEGGKSPTKSEVTVPVYWDVKQQKTKRTNSHEQNRIIIVTEIKLLCTKA